MARSPKSSKSANRSRPSRFDTLLEYSVAGLGLAFVLGSLAIVGKSALGPSSPATPEVREIGRRLGHDAVVVEVEVLNRGDRTAVALTLEARAGDETAQATIDYLPGHSRRQAALSLPVEAARGPIDIAATGWAAP